MSIGNRKFMKNKSESRIGRVLASIFNIRSWFDWDRFKTLTLFLWNGAKKFFVLQQGTENETFEAAKKRLHLTDADLLSRQQGLLRVSIVMIVLAFLFFLYSVYHFYCHSFKGGLLSLVVMSLALTLAFRYHFWYFQIKERKLGCSFHEWYKNLMGDK